MASKRASRLAAGGAVAAAFFTFLVGWEGLRLTPYFDVVGVKTWCAGETQGTPKARYTLEECRDITVKAAERYAKPVEDCITRPMPDTVFIAFVSLAYNIGHTGFCRSNVAFLYNKGLHKQACDAMLAYNKGGRPKREIKGLTNRRHAERKLCLQGANL